MFVIEVVLDETQQRAPSRVNALKVLAEFRRQRVILKKHFTVAEDVIDRRPQIMADTGKVRTVGGGSHYRAVVEAVGRIERISASRSSAFVAPFCRMRATSPLSRRRSSSERSLAVITMTGTRRQSGRARRFSKKTNPSISGIIR